MQGHLLSEIRANGIINSEHHCPEGSLITAHIPRHSSLLQETAKYIISTYKYESLIGHPSISEDVDVVVGRQH